MNDIYRIHMTEYQLFIINSALRLFERTSDRLKNEMPNFEADLGALIELSDPTSEKGPSPLPVLNGWCS